MPQPPAVSAGGSSDLPPHPFDDVPQTFTPGTSHTVRNGLQDFIERDLLGPWDGELEELRKSAGPRDRYLVGMLGPKPAPAMPGEVAREAAQAGESEPEGDGDAQEAELIEQVTPHAAGRIWASSMGLSFVVPAAIGTLTVEVSWGRYDRSEALTDAGKTERVWAREPFSKLCDINVATAGDKQPCYLEGDENSPHVKLNVHVRERAAGPGGEELRVVEVALVNALEDSAELRDRSWLFQTRLKVNAFPDASAAVFLPIDDPMAPSGATGAPEDPEERRLRLLYRDELRHAIGRNVAVHADVRPGERHAHRLTTTWLPAYDVPMTTAPTVEEQTLLEGLELSMDNLAELALPARRGELATALVPLAEGYGRWLVEQRSRAAALPDDLRKSADVAIDQAEDICVRIGAGIETLTEDPIALEAFRFANRTMALQRRNTAIAELRAAAEDGSVSYDQAKAIVDERGKGAATWRPFQLAFVLLNLQSLTEPTHPHRGTGRQALVDLLFFPTGGGKTEAYLGLAAYTFALRRLQGTIGTGLDARRGDDGVGVLMRYTLRLLTAQQFQRAAALVCAAEVLRREAYAQGDTRWGRVPFRIGLWVGGTVSPNRFEEAQEQIAMAKESGDGRYAGVIQVASCPWCGEAIRPQKDVVADEDRRRILIYCPRGEGADVCQFSKKGFEEKTTACDVPGFRPGLPVVTVDEEIYRLVPSLLIATVDKLAQLPSNGAAGLLFGDTTTFCSRHGYRHEDLDAQAKCGSRHQRKGSLPAVTSVGVGAVRPPDLIIQDELHLISGALGTIVGLFESAVDQLCSWPVVASDGVRHLVGPKIIASTATTKRAAEQVRGVFGRDVAVFPPQVVDHTDTFFSRQVSVTEATPGRRYLGVCAHGTRLKSAEIRLAEILLRAAQQQFDTYGAPADPYMTLVGYFNATRELAGMRRYLDDDVTTRLRHNPHRDSSRLADRIPSKTGMLVIEELTSRISSNQIGAALTRLQGRFDPERDTSLRARAINVEVGHALGKKPPRVPRIGNKRIPPVDAVLATSMLQVGVDVSRFGLMLVVGQPKNTAEYIQASSRVGRDACRPGLVVTLYNWSRPRDLAHFEDFEHYHATFYRQVEALSVTPFTRRALDRGTTATYVTALRHARHTHSRNTDAQDLDLDGEEAQQVEARLLNRAEAVGGTRARDYLYERIQALKDLWHQRRGGNAQLGFRSGSTSKKKDQLVVGLLRPANGSRWDALTVPQSMRETENEINLLLPGSDGFGSMAGPSPEWDFSAAQESRESEESPA
ncbi:DISARM system helicase DrmA [Embleya sp. NPDC050493]|uniref:DISARM system helicase DrmA n=1 Tax=Embleya sp. NPDC050493 TaxID=3363989 RepID=UPI0037B72539